MKIINLGALEKACIQSFEPGNLMFRITFYVFFFGLVNRVLPFDGLHFDDDSNLEKSVQKSNAPSRAEL